MKYCFFLVDGWTARLRWGLGNNDEDLVENKNTKIFNSLQNFRSHVGLKLKKAMCV